MKRYHEYKSLQNAANAFAKANSWGRATAIDVAGTAEAEMGECAGYGYRKYTTGGYVSNSSDIFEEEINKQVLLAMDEAALREKAAS